MIKLGRLVKILCLEFPDCRHTQAIVKEIVLSVQAVIKDKSSNAKPGAIVSSMVCNRYPECELLLGQQLAIVYPKSGYFLVEKKKSPLIGGKQVVCSNGDYREEKIK